MNPDIKNPVQSQIDAVSGATPASSVTPAKEQQIPVTPEQPQASIIGGRLPEPETPSNVQDFSKDTLVPEQQEPVVQPVEQPQDFAPRNMFTAQDLMRQRFRPADTKYTLTMPDGGVLETNTLDPKKAMYEYLLQKSLAGQDNGNVQYMGYTPAPEPVKGSFLGGVGRGAWNFVANTLASIPEMAVGTAVPSTMDWFEKRKNDLTAHATDYWIPQEENMWGVGVGNALMTVATAYAPIGAAAGASKAAVAAGKQAAKAVAKKGVSEAVKDRFVKFSMYKTKQALMAGQPAKLMNGMNKVVAAGEIADAYTQAYKYALDNGAGWINSVDLALQAGSLTGLLAGSPEMIHGINSHLFNWSKKNIQMALKGNAKGLRRSFNLEAVEAGVLEGLSEVGQNAVINAATDQEANTEEDIMTFVLSAVTAGGLRKIANAKSPQEYIKIAEEWRGSVAQFLKGIKDFLVGQGGPRLTQNIIDGVLKVIQDPQYLQNAEKSLNDVLLENVDIFNNASDADKAKLQELLENDNLDMSIEGMESLYSELDNMNDGSIPQEKFEVYKRLIGGIASQQILNGKISKPSDILSVVPTVYGNANMAGGNIDYDTNTIELGTNTTARQEQRRQGAVELTPEQFADKDMRASANASNARQNIGKTMGRQSGTVATLFHELVGHYFTDEVIRKNPEALVNYMQIMQNALSEVFAGIQTGEIDYTKLSPEELDEYYAYAVQSSDKAAKQLLGFEGKGAALLNMLNQSLLIKKANVTAIQGYVNFLRAFMESNTAAVQAMISNHEQADDLTDNIKHFAKTGDLGSLTNDDLVSLDRVFKTGLGSADMKLDLMSLIGDSDIMTKLSEQLDNYLKQDRIAADSPGLYNPRVQQSQHDIQQIQEVKNVATKERVIADEKPNGIIPSDKIDILEQLIDNVENPKPVEEQVAPQDIKEPVKKASKEQSSLKYPSQKEYTDDMFDTSKAKTKYGEYRPTLAVRKGVTENVLRKWKIDTEKRMRELVPDETSRKILEDFLYSDESDSIKVELIEVKDEESGKISRIIPKAYGKFPGSELELTPENSRGNAQRAAQLSSNIAYALMQRRMANKSSTKKYNIVNNLSIISNDILPALEAKEGLLDEYAKRVTSSLPDQEKIDRLKARIKTLKASPNLKAKPDTAEELVRIREAEDELKKLYMQKAWAEDPSEAARNENKARARAFMSGRVNEVSKNLGASLSFIDNLYDAGRQAEASKIYNGAIRALANIVDEVAPDMTISIPDNSQVLSYEDQFYQDFLADKYIAEAEHVEQAKQLAQNPTFRGKLERSFNQVKDTFLPASTKKLNSMLRHEEFYTEADIAAQREKVQKFQDVVNAGLDAYILERVPKAVAKVSAYAEATQDNIIEELKSAESRRGRFKTVLVSDWLRSSGSRYSTEQQDIYDEYRPNTENVVTSKKGMLEKPPLGSIREAVRALTTPYREILQRNLREATTEAKTLQAEQASFAEMIEDRKKALATLKENEASDNGLATAMEISSLEESKKASEQRFTDLRNTLGNAVIPFFSIKRRLVRDDVFGPLAFVEESIAEAAADTGVKSKTITDEESGKVEENITQDVATFNPDITKPSKYGFEDYATASLGANLLGVKRIDFANELFTDANIAKIVELSWNNKKPEYMGVQLPKSYFYAAAAKFAKEKIKDLSLINDSVVRQATQVMAALDIAEASNQAYEKYKKQIASPGLKFSDNMLIKEASQNPSTKMISLAETPLLRALSNNVMQNALFENYKFEPGIEYVDELDAGDIIRYPYGKTMQTGVIYGKYHDSIGHYWLVRSYANGQGNDVIASEHIIPLDHVKAMNESTPTPLLVNQKSLTQKEFNKFNEAFDNDLIVPEGSISLAQVAKNTESFEEEIGDIFGNPEIEFSKYKGRIKVSNKKWNVVGKIQPMESKEMSRDQLEAAWEKNTIQNKDWRQKNADMYAEFAAQEEAVQKSAAQLKQDAQKLFGFKPASSGVMTSDELREVAQIKNSDDMQLPKTGMKQFATYTTGIVSKLQSLASARKINKTVFSLGAHAGISRSYDMLFGTESGVGAETLDAIQRQQDISEKAVDNFQQDIIKHITDKEVGLTTKDFNQWNIERRAELPVKADIVIAGDNMQLPVTIGEAQHLYMAKLVETSVANVFGVNEYKYPIANMDGGNGVYTRLKQTYSNADAIVDALSERDKKIAKAMLDTLFEYAARGQRTFRINYGTLLSAIDKGWAARNSTFVRATRDQVLDPEQRFVVLDLFDNCARDFRTDAVYSSGVMEQVRTMYNVLNFYKFDSIEQAIEALGLSREYQQEDVNAFNALRDASLQLRNTIYDKIGGVNFNRFMNHLDRMSTDAHYVSDDLMPAWWGRKLSQLTRSNSAAALAFKPKNFVQNLLGNFARYMPLADNQSVAEYYSKSFADALIHLPDALKEIKDFEFVSNRYQRNALSSEYQKATSVNSADTLLSDIAVWSKEHKNPKTTEVVEFLDNFAKKMTNLGVGVSTSLGDYIGLAMAWYAVKSALVNKHYGNVDDAKKEFEIFTLNNISSSNVGTRGDIQDWLAKHHLEAFCMFLNDSIQSASSIMVAVQELHNTKDPAKRRELHRIIAAHGIAQGTYIATQIALTTALIGMVAGGLSDEEEDYLIESSTRELFGMLSSAFPTDFLIRPIIDAIIEGKDSGKNTILTGPMVQMFAALHNGKFLEASIRAGEITGFGGLSRAKEFIEGVADIIRADSNEGVKRGLSRMYGFSKNASMKMLGQKETKSGRVVEK